MTLLLFFLLSSSLFFLFDFVLRCTFSIRFFLNFDLFDKHRLVSGTRHLKNLNLQRIQAEYETQDIQDHMDQAVKTFDARVCGESECLVTEG